MLADEPGDAPNDRVLIVEVGSMDRKRLTRIPAGVGTSTKVLRSTGMVTMSLNRRGTAG